jgi:hypothetical protein
MASINDLTSDHKNARRRTDRSTSLIAESLKRYGAARSIVIDEDGRILAGNGTVEGAKKAGINKVRVIEAEGDELIAVRRAGLTEEEKVGLALADNRSSDLSEWDQEMLHHLAKDNDLSPWFEQTELDTLFENAEAVFPELDDSDKQPFQQMAFTLHDDQALTVQEALTKAKAMGNFEDSLNDNSNGNALARVAELFLSWGSDHGLR